METSFKTWAIVELMGHAEFAGYVHQESIAGVHMLRIDVPQTSDRPAFTKYVSPSALYGISPCSEETARHRAEQLQAVPFNAWGIESQVVEKLRKEGRLLEAPKTDAGASSMHFDVEVEHEDEA